MLHFFTPRDKNIIILLIHDTYKILKALYFSCQVKILNLLTIPDSKKSRLEIGKSRDEKITNKMQLARIVAKSIKTIRRETSRDLIFHQRADTPFEVTKHNADYAQKIAKYESSEKGPSIKNCL